MPGGKIHFGEKFIDAAYREVLEETGMKISKDKLRVICISDDILTDVHFVTIGILCEDFEGEPKAMEPDEILRWEWFSLNNLPSPIYLPSKKIIEKYSKSFFHRALGLNEKTKIVFIAMSKNLFYFRRHAVKFTLEQGYTPISQFGIFDYFLLDTIDRDMVRRANNNLIRISEELWVFGPISDGVLAEIKLARQLNKTIRYFKIMDSKEIKEISKDEVEFEEGLEKYSSEL
jgi:ADP-ribose pyrophosphatase YjhB (NUDIX family)